MIDISKEVADWPVVGDWSVSPGVEWCDKGNLVIVGRNCKLGRPGRVGNFFKVGDDFRAGVHFYSGDSFRAGKGFRAGDFFWAGVRFYVGINFRAGDYVCSGDDFKAGDNARFIAALGCVDGYPKSLCAVRDVAYIGAGCRWFTLSEAFEHWEYHDQDRRMTVCLLAAAREMAKLHKLRER